MLTTNFNVLEAWKDLYNQTSNLYDEKSWSLFLPKESDNYWT